MSRPKPTIIQLDRPFSSAAALSGSNLESFVDRGDQISRTVRGLAAASGTRYLITGYPGVGKTSFATRVVAEWRKLCEIHGVHRTLIFHIRLAKPQSAADVVKEIAGKLHSGYEDGQFVPNKQLADLLHLIYSRTNSKTVKEVQTKKDQNERGGELNAQVPTAWRMSGSNAKLTRKATAENTRTVEFEQEYKLSTAVSDLENALHLLTQSRMRARFPFRPAAQGETRVLFILDQLDDLTIMEDLSGVFEIPYASFLVLGGVELQKQIMQAKATGLQTLDSFQAEYLPCQWNRASHILSRVVPKSAMSTVSFAEYGDYLNFFGQGLPRQALKQIDPHIVGTAGDIFVLNESEQERVRLCAKLHRVIWKNRGRILGEHIDSVHEYQRDKELLGVYVLADKIFRSMKFTFIEATTVVTQMSATIMHRERDQVLKNLLVVLVKENLLSLVDEIFTLHDDVLRQIEKIPGWLHDSSPNIGAMLTYIENEEYVSLMSTGMIDLDDRILSPLLNELHVMISREDSTTVIDGPLIANASGEYPQQGAQGVTSGTHGANYSEATKLPPQSELIWATGHVVTESGDSELRSPELIWETGHVVTETGDSELRPQLSTQTRSPLQIGTQLNNGAYEIRSVLGFGGFGITYRGHDIVLDRPVAIKEFFPSACARVGLRLDVGGGWTASTLAAHKRKFFEEGRALAKLHHAGIVQIYSVFEENDTTNMVMQFVEGQTLEEYRHVLGGRLPVVEALEMIQQAGAGLTEVHTAGLLHRDIKPSNIMRRSNGRVILIDFGATREFESEMLHTQTVTLTRGYAPPEQYDRKGKRGAFIDVYALAATLYCLLVGDPPTDGSVRAIEDNLQSPRYLRSDMPEKLSNGIMAGLQLRPADRPATVEEFLQLLT